MKSLAVIRATDILKLRATLLEMNKAGLSFEGKPKEINLSSAEKMLSGFFKPSNVRYELCVLLPLKQDCEYSQHIIKRIPTYSEVIVLDDSKEVFKKLSKLLPMLPELVFPNRYKNKQNTSQVYLGVLVNKRVLVETFEHVYEGVLKHADSIGVLFEPSNGSSPIFFTWHDIKKIIIPKKKKKY